jgi:hypothetical protein
MTPTAIGSPGGSAGHDQARAYAEAAKIGAVRIELDDSKQFDAVVPDAGSPSQDPERQLLDAITAGELDEHLVAFVDAVHARRQLLHTVRCAQAIAELCVGDTVMFTNRIRPRYLEHELAEVTDVDDPYGHRLALAAGRALGRGRASVPAARATQAPPRNLDPR